VYNTLNMNNKQIRIDGVTYNIIHVKPFTHNEKQRYSLTLMRRKGKIKYYAFLYENGKMSKVASMGGWSFK
jgi:hypothetical protein